MVQLNNFQINMLTRSLSGFVLTVIILLGIMIGGFVWEGIAFAAAFSSLWEYYRMVQLKYKVSRGIGFILAILIFVGAARGIQAITLVTLVTLAAFVILLIEILRRQISGTSYALWNIGGTISGILYIILPWAFMVLLRLKPSGNILLLTLFLCTWSCDVAAFLSGSCWGRHLLCEKVSPKKTWEGALFGLVASILCSAIVAYLFSFPPFPLLLIGLICGIAGQLGDLGESVIKREAGVKDSGSIIPGHGGMLDRFDSILISAVLVFLLFEVIWY